MVVIWGSELGKMGRCWSKGTDLRCKMSTSWGGMCSMLTIVNPVLWKFDRRIKCRCCHHTQTMGIWRWWMCWFVVSDKYFSVHMCHMDTTCMECIHNTFLIGRSMSVKLEKKKVGGRLDLTPWVVFNTGFTWDHEAFCLGMFCTPPPSDTVLRISCGGVAPGMCTGRKWFRFGSCIEHQDSYPPLLRLRSGPGGGEGALLWVGLDQGLLCDLRGMVGWVEVPPAAVCVRPQEAGSVIQGQVWESPVLVSVRELTVLSPSSDSGHKGLSVPHSEGFPVCRVGAREGGVLTLSTEHHVFHLFDMPWRFTLPEGEAQKRRKMKENKSGMALSQVRSYSQWILSLPFLKCLSLDLLIVSDSGVSSLTPIHVRSPGTFPQRLSSPLRSHVPMTRWPGLCEEAPLDTVLGRASHPRVANGVSVLLGSRDCLGPIWMLCLLSVNRGKEAARRCEVFINMHSTCWNLEKKPMRGNQSWLLIVHLKLN